jgi:RimJ/RimL family protein N-acetyltransferase
MSSSSAVQRASFRTRCKNADDAFTQVQLELDRITLRDFRSEDLAEFQSFHGDPRYLRYYAPELSQPEHRRMLLEMFIDTAQAQPRRDFTLAIVERTSSRLIGCCSVRTAGQETGYAEFGLGVAPDYWGRGFATEAARAMLEFAFGELSCKTIHSQTVTENRRVERLLTRLGFEKLREQNGAEWMATLGWTHTDWSLEKPNRSRSDEVPS